MSKKKRPYTSVHDWMERTGTNTATLAAKTQIDQNFLGRILSKSRMCSLANARAISIVTGIPMDDLALWFGPAKPRSKPDGESRVDSAA